MKPIHSRFFLATAVAALLAASLSAAETNAPSNAVTRDEIAGNYLQIQEQIHATQLAIEQAQAAAAASARTNAEALAQRLQALEQSVAAQRSVDTEAARKTQQLTIFIAGAFGVAGLAIMLFMAYFQWRAFTQLAQISSQNHAALAGAASVHQLAAPGRATVETSNNRLLDVVSHLEKRIHELEDSQKLIGDTAGAKPSNLLAEAQKCLDAGQAQAALEALDKWLAAHPDHAEGLVKKAVALEKLGRTEEALAQCDRAIATDSGLAAAHLQKGGLLNRLRRYDEALNCFEHALLAQEKKAGNI